MSRFEHGTLIDINGDPIDISVFTGIGSYPTILNMPLVNLKNLKFNSSKCENLSILHFIGKITDINNNKYKNECDSINIPIINLPCVYFPFYYDTVETSINNISKLVPMLENNFKEDKNSCSTGKDKIRNNNIKIDKENLINAISNIMEKNKPYNNKNISYITAFVFIFWSIIILSLLKILYVKFTGIYTYIIIGLVISLLLFCSIWALVITSQNI